MLRVARIDTFYGSSHILHGVSLEVGAGELLSILGRNGAGKTTVLRSIAAHAARHQLCAAGPPDLSGPYRG